MANGFTIEIEGLTKLQKVFKELPNTARKGIQNELQAVGQEWRESLLRTLPQTGDN